MYDFDKLRDEPYNLIKHIQYQSIRSVRRNKVHPHLLEFINTVGNVIFIVREDDIFDPYMKEFDFSGVD